MKKSLVIAPFCLLAAACSGTADQADTADAPVALVTLGRVDREALAPQTTLYGATEPGPMGKLSLNAPAEAVVTAIDAPVGTAVTQGQVIARLVPSPTLRVDLTKAASDANAANAALARAQRLRADGLASNAEVETTAAAARSANALRASLAGRSAALTLRAPAAGVVDTVAVTIGDLIQPGAAVASVSRTGDMRARFGVDSATARALKPGMALSIAASSGRPALRVPIQSVNPVADPQTRLYAVFAAVPAASGMVIGETLTATVGTHQATITPSIPYAALLDDAGQPFVYVVTGGVAHRRDVVIGPTGGERIAIIKGVQPGDVVVVEGGTALEDGMKVRTK
ncbi:MAG TPA: efflux RND transporter periplasmic adaptor subunit [Sphingobium sp.]|uniref:efflux RND transporter periplasmic adaptor subunit n=1 Tax=Sphingobium sp. TaxID=1912891 RepID=UPI002ED31C5D